MFDVTEAIDDIIQSVNEDRYDEICDELDLRVESGELSLEDAQYIADYAAEQYGVVEEASQNLSPAAKQAAIQLRKLKQKYMSVKDKPEGAEILHKMDALQRVVSAG